jgi:hypothetical protein
MICLDFLIFPFEVNLLFLLEFARLGLVVTRVCSRKSLGVVSLRGQPNQIAHPLRCNSFHSTLYTIFSDSIDTSWPSESLESFLNE